MPISALLATLTLFAAPPAPRAATATATSARGGTKATATVRGKAVRVQLGRAKGPQLDVSVHLGEKCHAQKLAEVMASEIAANPNAFHIGRSTDISLWLPNLPGRDDTGGGDDGRGGGGDGGGGGLNPGSVPNGFEAQFADLLATGSHGKGGRGGGETCFDGTNFDVGTLMQANERPVPRGAKTVQHADGSSTSTATSNGVSTTWQTNAAGQHVSVSSSMSPAAGSGAGAYASGASVSFQSTDKGNGLLAHEATHFAQQGQASSSATFDSDGSSTSSQSRSSGTGDGKVSVSSDKTHDADGNTTSTKLTVKVDGKTAYQQETKGDGKSGDGKSDTKKDDKGGAPTMTAEGTVTMPPMCIPDEMVGQLINWSRLAEAVTDPSPIDDVAGEPTTAGAIKKNGPCGANDDEGFDPNPAFLMPNKQRWVTDPVPALRGDRRGRRDGR